MKRWVVLSLAVAAVIGACSSKTNGGAGAGSGDDAGDASHCPCVVPADEAGPGGSVACGTYECLGGTAYYYCSREGALNPLGGCPPVENEGGGFDASCTPSCPQGACNIDDGCGHLCACSQGLVCQNNVCGNGCAQTAGGYCGIGGDASTSCCQTGLNCQASGEAGVPTCCAITGLGTCTKDSDCCDYPMVHCDLGDGGPSAPDASKPSQKCIP